MRTAKILLIPDAAGAYTSAAAATTSPPPPPPDDGGVDLSDAFTAEFGGGDGAAKPAAKAGESTKPATKQAPPDDKHEKDELNPDLEAEPELEPKKLDAEKSADKEPRDMKQLREAYEALKRQHADAERKIADVSKAAPALVEVDALKSALAARDAALKEMQGKLAQIDFRESDEFKSTYVARISNATAKAQKLVGQLTVATGDGERAPTKQDLMRLVNAQDVRSLRELATEMFGDDGRDVAAVVREIWDADDAAQEAIKERAAKGDEFAKQAALKKVESEHELSRVKRELVAKNPVFAIEAGNAKEEEMAQAAERVASAVILGDSSLIPEGRMAEARANMMLRASRFGVMAARLRAAQAKVAELDKTIAGLRGSRPGLGEDGGKTAGDAANGGDDNDSILGAFDKTFKRSA